MVLDVAGGGLASNCIEFGNLTYFKYCVLWALNRFLFRLLRPLFVCGGNAHLHVLANV